MGIILYTHDRSLGSGRWRVRAALAASVFAAACVCGGETPAPPAPVDWGPPPGDPPPPATLPMAAVLVIASPDGSLLATVETGGPSGYVLRLRDAEGLDVAATLFLCLAGGPDDRALISCPDDRRPRVRALAFSPNGRSIAVACTGCAPDEASSLHVIDWDGTDATLRLARPLDFEPHVIGWGSELAVGGRDRLVFLDAGDGAEIRSIEPGVRALASDGSAYWGQDQVVWPADGKERSLRTSRGATVLPHARGYVVLDNGSVSAYDRGGRPRASQSRGGGVAVSSSDGRYVAASHHDHAGAAIRLIDMRTGRLLIDKPFGGGTSLHAGRFAVTPGGQLFVTSRLDGITRLQPPSVPTSLQVSPTGERIVAVEDEFGEGSTAVVRIRDAAGLDEIAVVPAGEPTGALAFSPDGRRVAVGDGESVSLATDGSIETRVPLTFTPRSLAWGAGGLAAKGGGELAIIDPASGHVESVTIGEAIESLAPDASRYCVRDQEPGHHRRGQRGRREIIVPPARIECISLLDGARATTIEETHGVLVSLAGSRWLHLDDSSFALHGSGDGVIRVEHPYVGNHRAASTPDGRFVARVDGSWVLRLYDTAAREHEVLRERLAVRPTALAVAPDGTVFVGRPGQGTLRFRPRSD
jgi:hypothetical protein